MKEALACGFLGSGRTLSNARALLAHAFVRRVAFAASIVYWPVASHFGIRVSIDAALFRALARDPASAAEAIAARAGR